MGSSSTSSFEACIEDCAATTDCIDVSYVSGACYKKNVLNTAVSLGHVWSAKLVPSDTESSDGSSSTTSTTTTTTATATETAITCPGSNGTIAGMSTGGTYQILCSIDYAGGDFKEVDTPTFEECLEACDNNAGCVALSYVAPSCYLKSELMTPVSVSYVWGAVVKKAATDLYAFPTVADKPLDAGATESMMASIMTLESPPLATLGPVAPPGINMGGLKVLTPDPQAQLWYNGADEDMENEDSGAVTVRLTIDYKYPSIVLDHSIYIKDVSCAGGVLTGSFSEQTPFLHAAQEWPSQAPILLITSAQSCGNGAQNSFWLASSVTFDVGASTFSAPGEITELADIYEELTADFGKIEYDEDADDGTTGSDDADSCGSPSSSTLDDLPAVACGANFDKALDEALGYYSASRDGEQMVLAAAGVDTSESGTVIERGLSTHVLHKRWSLWGAIKSVAKAVVKAVVTVVKVVAAVVVQVVQKAVEVVVTVVKAVVAVSIAVATQVAKLAVFIATGNYSNSLTLPVNLGPPASVQQKSPWDSDGFKFYTYSPEEGGEKWKASKTALEKISDELLGEADPEPGIELWCVDCGVRGKVVATGSISATPLSGLKKGTIGVDGNMYAGVFLGVNAYTQWEKTVRKDLFVKGLPGWSIPGIVSLGPRLILGAQATFEVEAEGQLITGASLNWPAFHAELNFVDSSKSSQSGWKPEITKKFQVHGDLSAKAALGLPVTLNFGINILNGVFEKGINLTDIPAITAEATLEIDVGTDKTQLGSDECEGIDWSIALTNEVRLDVSDVGGWTLNEWASPALASGCIGRTRDSSSSDSGTDDTTTTNQPAVEDLSLKCPAADGTTYTDSNSNTYAVKCSTDAPGNDIAYSVQSTFDDCINWCGTVSGCVGVAYAKDRTDQNCWLKSVWANFRSDTGYQYSTASAQMNSPFTIMSMFYADKDVTGSAAANIVSGNRLIIDTNNIWRWAGDPWGGNAKSIFMLYMYGAETRTFVAVDGQGTFTISPGSISNAPMSEIAPTYGQQWGVYNLKIVAAAYGRNAITDTNVWADMYYRARYYGSWPFTNGQFRWDTWVGTVKSGVIWYMDTESGAFYAMAVRENQVGQFAQVKSRRKARSDEALDAPYSFGNGTISASNSTMSNSTVSVTTPESTPEFTPESTLSTTTSTDSDFPKLTTTNSTTNATGSSDFPQLSITNSTDSNSTESGVFPQLSLTNSTADADNSTIFTLSTLSSSEDDSELTLTPFRVVDTTNTLLINPGTNGNLFLSIVGDSADISTLTSGSLAGDAESKTVVGDTSSRLLHYYPSVMESTGASRLRLAKWDELPNGSKLITLTPIETQGVSMLMAIDADGDYFWPFFCGIKGQLNKVFLVKDPDAGAAALEKENMKFTVTGGDAYSCSPLALLAEAA